jgi:hypothetical protein
MCRVTSIHLRIIALNIDHKAMENEAAPVHEFVEPGLYHLDWWSRTFRHLSTLPALVTLRVRGGAVVCPEIFQSIDSIEDPYPSLQDLEFRFAPETADGNWFYKELDVSGCSMAMRARLTNEQFQRENFHNTIVHSNYARYYYKLTDPRVDMDLEDEESASQDSYPSSIESQHYAPLMDDAPVRTGLVRRDVFRLNPDKETLLTFLSGAAKTASRLKKLQKFLLHMSAPRGYINTSLPFRTRVLSLWYLKAGASLPTEDDLPIEQDGDYIHVNRVYWRVGRWTPWEEAENAWKRVVGPDGKIVFVENDMY